MSFNADDFPFVLRCEEFFNLAGGVFGRSLGTATNINIAIENGHL
jgi:hypothetical protein